VQGASDFIAKMRGKRSPLLIKRGQLLCCCTLQLHVKSPTLSHMLHSLSHTGSLSHAAGCSLFPSSLSPCCSSFSLPRFGLTRSTAIFLSLLLFFFLFLQTVSLSLSHVCCLLTSHLLLCFSSSLFPLASSSPCLVSQTHNSQVMLPNCTRTAWLHPSRERTATAPHFIS
jgi:hypothetical protein